MSAPAYHTAVIDARTYFFFGQSERVLFSVKGDLTGDPIQCERLYDLFHHARYLGIEEGRKGLQAEFRKLIGVNNV